MINGFIEKIIFRIGNNEYNYSNVISCNPKKCLTPSTSILMEIIINFNMKTG